MYDAPDGQWAKPPAFPSGGGGLVSTVDDVHAFARMLLSGGRLPDGSRLLSRASVEAMTTDQIGVDRGAPGRRPTARRAGGSASASRCAAPGSGPPSAATAGPAASARRGRTIPAEGLVGVVLTTDMFTGRVPPAGGHPGLLDLRVRGAPTGFGRSKLLARLRSRELARLRCAVGVSPALRWAGALISVWRR